MQPLEARNRTPLEIIPGVEPSIYQLYIFSLQGDKDL